MIERPEAITLAHQIGKALTGRRIKSAQRENSPHKWAFYSRDKRDYETIPVGKTIGKITSAGSLILIPLRPGYVVQLGDGGERIALLDPGTTLPKKYHLLWEFEDGRRLTVSVMGWGAVRLLDREQFDQWRQQERDAIDPVDDGFTYEGFCGFMEAYAAAHDKPVKAMLTSQSRVRGIGNGYLQDILHRAGLHPTHKVRRITAGQRRRLYLAIRRVLTDAVKRGGRDDELDLFGRPGRYVRTMDKRALGKPCPRCKTAIEKLSYLGGTCYVCPACQPTDPAPGR